MILSVDHRFGQEQVIPGPIAGYGVDIIPNVFVLVLSISLSFIFSIIIIKTFAVGSVLISGVCWCDVNYRSNTGFAPCYPCGNNSSTTTTGSVRCTCAINCFSFDGFDYSNNSCNPCPQYTYTREPGTAGTSASDTCICGTSSGLSWTHMRFADGSYSQLTTFMDESSSIYPVVMTRSDSSYYPCYVCQNDTAPLSTFEYWSHIGGTPMDQVLVVFVSLVIKN